MTRVAPSSIQCVAMGEHGDSSMIPFSSITLMGKPLSKWLEENPKRYEEVSEKTLLERTHQLGMEIIIGKGSTEFGIGAALAEICKAVLFDEKKILPVSAYLEGEYGQCGIMELHLTRQEQEAFVHSCEVIRSYVKKADKEG